MSFNTQVVDLGVHSADHILLSFKSQFHNLHFLLSLSFQKDRPLRRKPGSDNRFKDERGNRRDRDFRANGADRYDRSDNAQSSDFPSTDDGPDGANHDESMFDAFGGKGMHVAAPFPSDIPPPPVLMPVPGAG